MIEIRSERPKNREHFERLLEFGKQVVAICGELGVEPVLSGSLAVFGYTKNQRLVVNDLDLACPEASFARLVNAFDANGIAHELKDWHVLQVTEHDLKVDFDSMEYWMTDLPATYETMLIGDLSFKVIGLPGLQELYRRGLEANAGKNDRASQTKYSRLHEKYEYLVALDSAMERSLHSQESE